MASNKKLVESTCRRYIRCIWHVIALTQYGFGIFYDLRFVDIPKDIDLPMLRRGFGGRTRFLTYWCLVSYFPAFFL